MIPGFLEVITGPVCAGKTDTLIKKIKRANGRALVLGPELESSSFFGICQIASHNGETYPCLSVSSAEDLENLYFYNWLFIDDIHLLQEPYFHGDIFVFINKMLANGCIITCAGRDYDENGQSFPLTEKALQTAEAITQLTAKCSVCGNPASFTYYDEDEGSHQPRCSRHFNKAAKSNLSDNSSVASSEDGNTFL